MKAIEFKNNELGRQKFASQLYELLNKNGMDYFDT